MAEEKSITVAATRRLRTAQPSLSRQLRELETEVGAELMTRSARGIELTAAGKVFLTSQEGKATVIKAGADWEILAVNNLEDDAYATPAIVDNKLYVRTRGTMYCFGDKD